MTTFLDWLKDGLNSIQTGLDITQAIPKVAVATAGAATGTTGITSSTPAQTAVNAASGQMASPAVIDNILPSISLPDFSVVDLFGSSDASSTSQTNWWPIALVGGAALLGGMMLAKKN